MARSVWLSLHPQLGLMRVSPKNAQISFKCFADSAGGTGHLAMECREESDVEAAGAAAGVMPIVLTIASVGEAIEDGDQLVDCVVATLPTELRALAAPTGYAC